MSNEYKLNPTFILDLDYVAGSTITALLERAHEIATQTGVWVSFTFDLVPIVVKRNGEAYIDSGFGAGWYRNAAGGWSEYGDVKEAFDYWQTKRTHPARHKKPYEECSVTQPSDTLATATSNLPPWPYCDYVELIARSLVRRTHRKAADCTIESVMESLRDALYELQRVVRGATRKP